MSFVAMGPRQITGVSRPVRRPIDMNFTPWRSTGWIMPFGPAPSGRSPPPSIVGTEGP